MTSRDLTREQLDHLMRTADRQVDYFLRLWRRCEANGIDVDDPLGLAVCRAWEALVAWQGVLGGLRERLPQHYRPLASPHKASGLASRTHPWAEVQRGAAEAVARHAERAADANRPSANEPQVEYAPLTPEELATLEANRQADRAKYPQLGRGKRRRR